MTQTTVINIIAAPGGRASDAAWRRDHQYVYIGRSGHGLIGHFGNPYPAGRLADYDDYLLCRLDRDLIFRDMVKQLAGKTLVCFCKPKPCHGDFLATCADALAAGML